MPGYYSSFVNGNTLDGSNVTNYLMKQCVIQATSSSRPASPHEGMTVYETDTDKLMTYNNIAWTPPWNLPWGLVGYAELTSNATGTTTTLDISGLSITWTAITNRRYKVRAHTQVSSSVASDGGGVIIADGSSNQLAICSTLLGGIGIGSDVTAEVIKTFTAGSNTVKARVIRVAGSGTITPGAAASAPQYISVEDIGPLTSAPA